MSPGSLPKKGALGETCINIPIATNMIPNIIKVLPSIIIYTALFGSACRKAPFFFAVDTAAVLLMIKLHFL